MRIVNIDTFNDQLSSGPYVETDGTYIYKINTNRLLTKHDSTTLNTLASATVFSSSVQPTDLVIVGSSAYITSSSARMTIVNLNNLLFSDVTTNMSATVTNVRRQQISYNPAANLVIVNRNVSAGLTRINANQTATQVTLSHYLASGGVVNVITAKTASTHDGFEPAWICGTAQGTIIEVSSSMAVTKGFSLPTASTLSGSTTQQVTGISYYYPYLAATTNLGLLYLFDYRAGSAIQVLPVSNSAVLCNASSGVCMIGLGTTKLGSRSLDKQPYVFMDLSVSPPIFTTKIMPINSSMLGISLVNNKAIFSHNTSLLGNYKTTIFTLDDRTRSVEETEIREPQTTIDAVSLPGRIIRIVDEGIGQTGIEVDTSISGTPTNLPCRKSYNYIELAISNDNLNWDIREFSK